MGAIGECNELLALDLQIGGIFPDDAMLEPHSLEPVLLESDLQNLSYLRTNLPVGFIPRRNMYRVRHADLHVEHLIKLGVSFLDRDFAFK